MKSYLTPKILAAEIFVSKFKEVLFVILPEEVFTLYNLEFNPARRRVSSLSCAYGQEEILQINLLRSLRKIFFLQFRLKCF